MTNARHKTNDRALRAKATLAALGALIVGAFAAAAGPSSADVATVSGSATGASGFAVFGPNRADLAPTPEVTLPPTGSALPLTASAPSSVIAPNGFVIFSTGALSVSTQGTTGPGGSATSSSTVNNPELAGLTATSVSATCGASETAITGSTTVTGGRIVFADPDPATSGEAGENIVIVPPSPAANLSFTGPVENTPDSFRVVFNEQVVTPTSITVNAMHLFLLGPNATGEIIVGQVHCDIVAAPPVTTTTAPPVTTTTAPPVTTTTAPPVTTTTAPPVTTTAPPVTTTTAPPVTTTTAPPVTTTAPPVTTTAPPVTTTAPPVTTTAPPASIPSLRVDDLSVTEPAWGSAPANFTVRLSTPATTPVTVSFATTGAGTASAAADYTANSGQLVFVPGLTTAIIPVTVLADNVPEPSETFTLTLSDPVGATLERAVATATIVDSAPAAPFSYACEATAVTATSATLGATTTDPGVTGATFSLSRDGTAVGSPIAVSGVGPFSVRIEGLAAGTTYAFTVVFDPGAHAAEPCGFTTAAAPAPVPDRPSPLPPLAPTQAPAPGAGPAAAGSSSTGSGSGATSGTDTSASAGGAVTRAPLARTGASIGSQVRTALVMLALGALLAVGARRGSIHRDRTTKRRFP